MSSKTQQPKVLFVLTSHDKMGNTGEPTGWYLPEFAHPYSVLTPHVQISIASVNGGVAPLDPASIKASKDDISVNFLNTQESLWKNTAPLSDFVGKASEFAAVFFVGGHGPMFDLPHNSTSHTIINEFHALNRVIAAVCHGPAALAYVKLSSGAFLLENTPVTGFCNTEEENYGYKDAMPFSLEDALSAASNGKFVKAKEMYESNVVVSQGGKLITGQNPASAEGVGQAIWKELEKEGKSA